MFWGISLEAGKRYSQTVEKSFHISMAALNSSNSEKGSVTVMVEVEKACYPLCTLHPDRIPQQALDYVFTEGEEVLFYTEGDLNVHLTGYLLDEANPVECSSDEEAESVAESNTQSSDEEKQTARKNKPKKESSGSEEDNIESLISELDNLNQDNKGGIDLWLPRSARKRSHQVLEEGLEAQGSLYEKLLGNSNEESSEEDDDWQPSQRTKLPVLKKNGKYNADRKDNSNHRENKNNITLDVDDSQRKQMLSPSKSKKKSLKAKDVKASNGLTGTENIGCADDSDEKNCNQDEKLLGREDNKKMDSQNTEEKPHHSRKEWSGETVIEDLVKGSGKKAKKGKKI